MAEQDNTANADTDAQAANGQSAQPPEGADVDRPGGDNGDSLSPEDARKLRSEAQNLRKRLKDAERAVDSFKQSQMSEQERREQEAEQLRAELETTRKEARSLRVHTVAAAVGFRDPRDAALLDWDSIDDPDDREQVEKALRKLLKDRPHLGVGTDDIDAGARTHGPGRPQSMNELILAARRR